MTQEIKIQYKPISWPCNSCEKHRCDRCVASIMNVMSGQTTGKAFTNNPEFHCSCFRANPNDHIQQVSKKSQSELMPKPYLRITEVDNIESNTKFSKVFEVDD